MGWSWLELQYKYCLNQHDVTKNRCGSAHPDMLLTVRKAVLVYVVSSREVAGAAGARRGGGAAQAGCEAAGKGPNEGKSRKSRKAERDDGLGGDLMLGELMIPGRKSSQYGRNACPVTYPTRSQHGRCHLP